MSTINIWLAGLGLAAGSFVNALVWRLHQQLRTKRRGKASAELSILTGRSMCPDCKHTLAPIDLIPVVSWLSLRGRCRYCRAHISWQYPVVEILTAVAFVVSYQFWPAGDWLGLGIWLTVLTGLVALFIYDLKWMLLPDRIMWPVVGATTVGLVATGLVDSSLLVAVRDGLLGVFLGSGLFWALYAVSDGRWIGGGDVKLGILMGLLLGPVKVLIAIFLASLIGTVISLLLMVGRRVKLRQEVPFGPYLIAGTYIVMLWGQTLIDWYRSNLLGGL